MTSWGKTPRRDAPRNGAPETERARHEERGESAKLGPAGAPCRVVATRACPDSGGEKRRPRPCATGASRPPEHGGRGCPRPTEIPCKTFSRCVAPRTRAQGCGTSLPHGRARTRVGRPGEDRGRVLLGPFLPKAPRERRARPVSLHQTPGVVPGAGPPLPALGPGDPPEAVPGFIAASASGKTRSWPELSLSLRSAGGFEPRTNFLNIFYRAEQKL